MFLAIVSMFVACDGASDSGVPVVAEEVIVVAAPAVPDCVVAPASVEECVCDGATPVVTVTQPVVTITATP